MESLIPIYYTFTSAHLSYPIFQGRYFSLLRATFTNIIISHVKHLENTTAQRVGKQILSYYLSCFDVLNNSTS